ncbi:MAG: class I SAM-dependent methyltransferase, partial [Chloroflexota bacterium]
DLSPEMVNVARRRTEEFSNIEFVVADVNEWDFPVGQCDCVVSITTLHHMPLEPVLKKMRDALKPGGTLLIGDFYEATGLQKWAKKFLALLKSVRRKLRGSNRRPWYGSARSVGHDPNESYLTIQEVRRVSASLLPGAKIETIAKTYSLEWKKP